MSEVSARKEFSSNPITPHEVVQAIILTPICSAISMNSLTHSDYSTISKYGDEISNLGAALNKTGGYLIFFTIEIREGIVINY